MIKSLNTAATGMQAQQTNMDTIANNIANVSTNALCVELPEMFAISPEVTALPLNNAITSVG